MKMWRCANDFWGYCTGTPNWLHHPHDITPYARDKPGNQTYLSGGICKQDPSTCLKYRTLTAILSHK